jgi:hypothetical protein
VSPERPAQDDFLEDEEQEEYGQRSIFATGWFRAVPFFSSLLNRGIDFR